VSVGSDPAIFDNLIRTSLEFSLLLEAFYNLGVYSITSDIWVDQLKYTCSISYNLELYETSNIPTDFPLQYTKKQALEIVQMNRLASL